MAAFCVATKMQPSEYRSLTLREVEAFIDAIEKRHKSNPLEELM